MMNSNYPTQSRQVIAIVKVAGIAVRVSGGALKYNVRTLRYKFGDLEAVTTSDSFVSINYGF